jgi:hypothetical protein
MFVCFIATLESLQHVSAYMGHLQVIFLQILEYQVCLNKAHTHTVAIDGLLPYLLFFDIED